jgi:hypothetical protein
LAGLEVMPDERRCMAPQAAAWAMFVEDFDGRILAFEPTAAAA